MVRIPTVIYSKNPHKRTGVLGVQSGFVLLNRVFSENQPENVLQVFSKLFLLKTNYSTAYTINL